MNLKQQFTFFWQKNFPHLAPKSSHLFLAVSGGVDSVVLLDLVANAGFNFTIAHCNFNLRGEESQRDEQLVRSLANKYNKDVEVNQFDTLHFSTSNKLSIQEAARQLRYTWFKELLDNKKIIVDNIKSSDDVSQILRSITKHPDGIFNFNLLTAHHADDNIETLLFNFFRGTGIAGLHGILPKNGQVIRPLLFARRSEIIAYAQEEKLMWVEDSSNNSDKYSRNYIRHQVVPLMKNIFPNVEENLLNNIERFKEVEDIYQKSIEKIKASLIEQKGNEFHIPILKLQKQTSLSTIVYEIIKDYNFTSLQVDDVMQLFKATNAKFIASATHRIIKNRNWLIIAPLQIEPINNYIIIEDISTSVAFENGEIIIKRITATNFSINLSPAIAAFDAAEIEFPLLLRKYKVGDYFYPFGMTKKKKLSRFFIDNKLSTLDKEKIWVLESNKKIIWIVGLRMDNRFKITPTTKNIISFQMVSSI